MAKCRLWDAPSGSAAWIATDLEGYVHLEELDGGALRVCLVDAASNTVALEHTVDYASRWNGAYIPQLLRFHAVHVESGDYFGIGFEGTTSTGEQYMRTARLDFGEDVNGDRVSTFCAHEDPSQRIDAVYAAPPPPPPEYLDLLPKDVPGPPMPVDQAPL